MKEICRQGIDAQEGVLVDIVNQLKEAIQELNRRVTKMPGVNVECNKICTKKVQ